MLCMAGLVTIYTHLIRIFLKELDCILINILKLSISPSSSSVISSPPVYLQHLEVK